MLDIFVLAEPGARLPTRSDPGSLHDLYAYLPENDDLLVQPGQTRRISTGLCLKLPRGYFAQLLPKSGLALQGLTLACGTIDNTYRREKNSSLSLPVSRINYFFYSQGHRVRRRA